MPVTAGTAHYRAEAKLRLPQGRSLVPRPAHSQTGTNPTEWKEHVRSDASVSQSSVAPYAVDEKQSQPRSKSRSRNNPTGRNPALRDASAGGGTQRRAHVNVRMRDSRTDPQVSVGTMLTLRRVGARATAHTVATCHLCKTSRGPLTLPPSDRPRWSARRSTPRTTSVSTAGAVPALLHP